MLSFSVPGRLSCINVRLASEQRFLHNLQRASMTSRKLFIPSIIIMCAWDESQTSFRKPVVLDTTSASHHWPSTIITIFTIRDLPAMTSSRDSSWGFSASKNSLAGIGMGSFTSPGSESRTFRFQSWAS